MTVTGESYTVGIDKGAAMSSRRYPSTSKSSKMAKRVLTDSARTARTEAVRATAKRAAKDVSSRER